MTAAGRYTDVRQLQARVVTLLKATPIDDRAEFVDADVEEIAQAITASGHAGVAQHFRAAIYLRCPYCWKALLYVYNRAKTLYGREHADYGAAWACFDCGAHVGVHKSAPYPMGSVANAELRQIRGTTHRVIDPNWRCCFVRSQRQAARTKMYRDIAETLRIPIIASHISLFDTEACKIVMDAHCHPAHRWQVDSELGG